jgi:archaellum component FlaC
MATTRVNSVPKTAQQILDEYKRNRPIGKGSSEIETVIPYLNNSIANLDTNVTDISGNINTKISTINETINSLDRKYASLEQLLAAVSSNLSIRIDA